jgi:hypothetical protein
MDTYEQKTPGQNRTAAATAANMRRREKKLAAILRERGWLVFEPGDERITEWEDFAGNQ